eukprot:NODE_1404_length_975_cov_99.062635_g973_i0.p1 GENE.NODE_1404_length_975_cov_99.062635_g973_i0~~NODE_1404_length_975_cov_99.062635_g973_i0.p1  ORF type:complete len:137 (+),score=14.33 NODE_1404_length_975_cov_99.062635_g973_i0:123-533(+)
MTRGLGKGHFSLFRVAEEQCVQRGDFIAATSATTATTTIATATTTPTATSTAAVAPFTAAPAAPAVTQPPPSAALTTSTHFVHYSLLTHDEAGMFRRYHCMQYGCLVQKAQSNHPPHVLCVDTTQSTWGGCLLWAF